MEEKERYRFFETVIQDTEYQNTDVPQSLMDKTLCCIRLNEQDARIKELEEENQQLKQQLAESEKALEAKESVNRIYKATLTLKDSDFSDLVRENAKLKQQLHDLPKKIVDEIKENNTYLNSSKPNQKNHIYDSYLIEAKTLDSILKKYGGEDE